MLLFYKLPDTIYNVVKMSEYCACVCVCAHTYVLCAHACLGKSQVSETQHLTDCHKEGSGL